MVTLDEPQVTQSLGITHVVHGDIGAQVAVHAAVLNIGRKIGKTCQGVHHSIIFGVAQVKKRLCGIAAVANRHAREQILNSRLDIALTCLDIGTVDVHLGFGTEQSHRLVHLLKCCLIVASRLLNLSDAIHCVIIQRLRPQNLLECLLCGIEVAGLEVGLGNQVGTGQRLGLQFLSHTQIGQFIYIIFTCVADACTQDVLVKAQFLIGFGREQHGLVDIGQRSGKITIIILLVSASKQDVIVVGILGEVVVIDLHHRIGHLVPEHGIAALSHSTVSKCYRNQRKDNFFDTFIHLDDNMLFLIIYLADYLPDTGQAGQQPLEQVQPEHVGSVALGL